MDGVPWKPWHQVVSLRDDVRSGEFSLSAFAADLYAVAAGERPDEGEADRAAQRIYRDRREFFARTFPTYNLRELVKTVLERLDGRSDKAVQQLELAYGGGKTHTLIALYHLTSDPASLPTDLQAVDEFTSHAGMRPPAARVAVLAFDKLDVERGMQVRAPDGATRWLKQPWSVLAYQLGGDAGLGILREDGGAAERDTAPAQNLLEEVLRLPGKQGLATLVLLDEVLMYAREKVGADPAWQSRIVNFFQYLTQAAVQVGRCAMVASLLASDPRKNDALGNEIAREIGTIFRRELADQGVLPVVKEDVAEVLRRRFFTAETIKDREAYRPHIAAALQGVKALDETTTKQAQEAEGRFLRSYPFHPDLTDVLYTKWTQIQGFQRTRGVLRIFALALRDAVSWDQAPLVSTNVFLTPPALASDADVETLSRAAMELTTIATEQEAEEKRHNWESILGGELAKARQIQRNETTGLRHREIEQAVMATFLHSQPISQKAATRDLLVLIGPTRPDRIELEKALLRWCDLSWFLDEGPIIDARRSPTGGSLPATWRLGLEPNLRQIHFVERERIAKADVDTYLLNQIGGLPSLKAAASAAGARVHVLPHRTDDVEEDGALHYVVLGPSAASSVGAPSAEAKRYLAEYLPGRQRRFKNAVVIAVPSHTGVDRARDVVRDYLAWDAVSRRFKGEELSEARKARLQESMQATRQAVPEAIRQAYSIVVTLNTEGKPEAFRVTVGTDPLFTTIKADPQARIQETAIMAEALLPGGPYNLWTSDEPSRSVKFLVEAFAEQPRLPKMLRRQAILDTIVQGCVDGSYVLRTTRPDRSTRTFWRQRADAVALEDPTLEIVLPEAATLTSIDPALLTPNALPGLWTADAIVYGDLLTYFSGAHVVNVPKDGYTESVTVPGAAEDVVSAAVRAAVQQGVVWLQAGGASLWNDDVPEGLLDARSRLHVPPQPIAYKEILPDALPEAYDPNGVASAAAILQALSARAGATLPWKVVARAIVAARGAYALQLTNDSQPLDAGPSEAARILLRLPETNGYKVTGGSPETVTVREGTRRVAEATMSSEQIQNLADALSGLLELVPPGGFGPQLTFRLTLTLDGGGTTPPEELVAKLNRVLEEAGTDLRFTPT